MKNLICLIIFLFIFSCQPIEKINTVVFDHNQLSKFDILAKSIEINEIFEKKISDPFIGHTLEIDPSQRIINWANDNFKTIGNENLFVISILDASLSQTEFKNKEAKNFDEKINYKYELFYLIEFNLFDNSGNLISTTLVEISRSTTSGLLVSIQDKENIINDLIYNSLRDLSYEANLQIKKYMGDFIL